MRTATFSASLFNVVPLACRYGVARDAVQYWSQSSTQYDEGWSSYILNSKGNMPTIERVTPILVYEDLAAAHDFLVDAFGFEPGAVERDGSGTAVHAEVSAGGTTIWLHRVSPEHNLASAGESSTGSSGLYVHVDDVDAHFMRAQAKGAKVTSPPQDRSYGVREYASQDAEGHRWWFGAPAKVD
jgi:uncharacterized glyoxalase superfamily protein PhnB